MNKTRVCVCSVCVCVMRRKGQGLACAAASEDIPNGCVRILRGSPGETAAWNTGLHILEWNPDPGQLQGISTHRFYTSVSLLLLRLLPLS